MAKNKVSEWSSTPANNTDVGGIDINEGCAPSGINNAIRDVMAQIKDMQTGADNDNFVVGGNLTVNGTSTLTGAVSAPAGVTGNLTGNVTGNLTGNASGTALNVTGTVAVSNGGTGATSLTANNVILGNGTSAVQFVAPGTSGNVLKSNGTTWESGSAPIGISITTGSAPYYGARAWVNFNGSSGSIRSSANVTSITKNGTGDYTINFTTSMPDENYSVCGTAYSSNLTDPISVSSDTYNTSSIRVKCIRYSLGAIDSDYVNIQVFR